MTREEMRHIVRGMEERRLANAFPVARLLEHAAKDIGPRKLLPAPPSVLKEGWAWTAQWSITGGTVKVYVIPQKPPSPWMKPLPRGQATIALDGMAIPVVYQFKVEES